MESAMLRGRSDSPPAPELAPMATLGPNEIPSETSDLAGIELPSSDATGTTIWRSDRQMAFLPRSRSPRV